MTEKDYYLTLKAPSAGFYKEKGSKFYGYAFPVQNEEQVKDRLEELKQEYHSARHHCFAYVLGKERDRLRANDDGEPNNSAGMPILNQLHSKELTNTLIVVIRYFGGTKLGVSGLINAYKTAAAEALESGKVIRKTVDNTYQITFEYPQMGEVMRVLNENNLEQVERDFQINCKLIFEVRQNLADEVVNKLKKIRNLEIKCINKE